MFIALYPWGKSKGIRYELFIQYYFPSHSIFSSALPSNPEIISSREQGVSEFALGHHGSIVWLQGLSRLRRGLETRSSSSLTLGHIVFPCCLYLQSWLSFPSLISQGGLEQLLPFVADFGCVWFLALSFLVLVDL